MLIKMRWARVYLGSYSEFLDGARWGVHAHDTPDYRLISERCGYSSRKQYCREHEVFHHLVGEEFYGGPSPVLWALAHGETPDRHAAALEEAMVLTLQRWVRGKERPIIGGVDWVALKNRALALLDV